MQFVTFLSRLLLSLQPAPAPSPPPVPDMLAPVRFEVVLGAGADGRTRCRVFINGEAGASDLICAMFMQSDDMRAFNAMPPDVSMIASVSLALEGDTVPPRSITDRGELILEGSAWVGVDREGRISDCRDLGVHLRGPLAGMPDMGGSGEPPQLCNAPHLSRDLMFRAAPGGAETRAGLLRLELYLRMGVSRTTA